MDWYYVEDGKQVGPMGASAIEKLVINGTINPGTLVWHEGMGDWRPYGEIQRDLIQAKEESMGASEEHFCSECGKTFPQDYMIKFENSWVCADCKPTYVQKLKEGGTVSGFVSYGGFWIRFVAKVIDSIILAVINILISFVPMLIVGPDSEASFYVSLGSMVIGFAVGVAYTTYFLGKFGATLGKMIFKLKVVRSDGSPLTYGRAFGRHFGDMLSGLTLYIGYIIAAFDEEKRALHDYICDTRVVRY